MAEECYQTCRVHSVDKHKMTTIDSALTAYARLAVAQERERLALSIKLIPVTTVGEAVLRQKIVDTVLALLSPAKEGE